MLKESKALSNNRQLNLTMLKSRTFFKSQVKPLTATTDIETVLRAYIVEFDGTKKKFKTVEHLFDALYHKDFSGMVDGGEINRKQLKKDHARDLGIGSKATLIRFQKAGESLVEVKIRWVNKRGDVLIHHHLRIEEGKFKILFFENSQFTQNKVF